MGRYWWLVFPVMGMSIPIVAILAGAAPWALIALIAGGALVGTTALITRSSIGEAIAEYIRAKARLKGSALEEYIQEAVRQELRSQQRRLSIEERKRLQTDFPGGIVVIMFTDMKDFTRYVERGDEQAYRVLQRHNQIIREAAERCGGRVVKSYGDGFMIAFSSARRAVFAAAGIQDLLCSYNRDRPLEEQIHVRIGLDAGEPLRDGDDYIGRAVNLAARITAIAEGGQVLISATVRQLAGPLQGLQYIDRGLHQIKGFSERQRLYEVSRIEALAYPLDSEIEEGLAELERRVQEGE
jgi:class 3 adenylate cyclase